jgi:hypothetical protein
MAFQCVTTCSNLGLNIRFSVRSLQYLCAREPGSCPQIRYLNFFWDSEIEGAGASSDTIISLGNSILCIFRQPLKYPCFSYSYLDGVRKYNVEILDSPS